MGGVATGKQAVLCSRNIKGPYEHQLVLAQGSGKINGPHQGAWLEDTDGKSWFLHFPQRGAHGRILWLEPVRWKDDWPLMRTAVQSGTNPGEPVLNYPMPAHPAGSSLLKIQTSDEFSSPTLAPMWEWNHNPDDVHWFLTERPGFLTLHPGLATGLLGARNTLTASLQDQSLQVTARLDTAHLAPGDHAGLSAIGISRQPHGMQLYITANATNTPGPAIQTRFIQFRAKIKKDTTACADSLDEGRTFIPLGTC